MSTFLVGDIQGCYRDLRELLDLAQFDHTQDHLYIAGDLVARGPDSLSVLRFVRSLGKHGHTVLGNHDLHLLAVAEGIMKPKAKDKTLPILEADDRDELLFWLRQQPLLIHEDISNALAPGFVMTHAGVPPCWNLESAKHQANDVEAILRSDRYLWLLQNMYANEPACWDESLEGIERYRFTINAFTRMRFCTPEGGLDMACKRPPKDITDENLVPWFALKNRQPIEETLVFGHWAALGGVINADIMGLDTGCVWGGSLTMVRWEDGQRFSLPCPIHAS
ncbi:symmetrical bis(5'-nucleosyl)-tetraphosphatase [Enterovibrio nigricans]|uniref:Bis(5'-nucleosyl)-tetraphosphatase, symmetrical n=1 Tax=Enterovibrio nigricans DSM 22720 TaxID=1121868 RepID=A0A1T4U1U5_9GAMM|nr:symmetrical bis(5'-nucleosyl)-tetraphosphatase [Enterovibrio nigricans]PKF51147.1 symmetrical bis(5'-nucleosyl)-tetraphosphatase [Enterovibrio nigricans]SKA46610.1 Bis(5'nucleosyl)-tetraphosphatase, ApaH [Enterovibrio nigricans DSM 22720]